MTTQQFLIGQRVEDEQGHAGVITGAKWLLGTVYYNYEDEELESYCCEEENLTALDPPPPCEHCKRLAALVEQAYESGVEDGMNEDIEPSWHMTTEKMELDKIMGDYPTEPKGEST